MQINAPPSDSAVTGTEVAHTVGLHAAWRTHAAVRRNLFALTVDVTAFAIGMAFLDENAVLPLLCRRLGASGVVIGAFAAIRFLGFNGVQVVVAWFAPSLRRQKPALLAICAITRGPLLLLPFALMHSTANSQRHQALVALIVLLGVWAVGDGLGYVFWMEIVARAFTDKTRGRFFAGTQVLTGIVVALVAGLVVRAILHNPHLPFAKNYAVLAAGAALMYLISLVGIAFVHEPVAPAVELPPARPRLKAYVARILGVLRENAAFRRLATIQMLIGFGTAAAPFYVIYAANRYHLSDDWGAVFQVASALGAMVLIPCWTVLAERRGPAAAVRAVAIAGLVTPVVGLLAGSLSVWLFCGVFFLLGGSLGWGLWIATNHYLLVHAPEHDRSLLVAMLSLFFVPSAIFPWLGGIIVWRLHDAVTGGIPGLLLITVGITACGFALAIRLPHHTVIA